MEKYKVASFEKDHDKIMPRLAEGEKNGDLTVYELRFIRPNSGRYISNAAMHSIEHIVAALIRQLHAPQDIVYFGPMGCRTGFYIITRNIDINRLRELLVKCNELAQKLGAVPGASKKECGNYKEHNLAAAKKYLRNFVKTI
jgi:S-ribosylhomocysteine lyase